MNEVPKVSVIVPLYNNQNYLHQCVDSILAQTLREIEIILVDDGSTDSCPQICDEYAARDPRVRVIHQPNGGSGVAFNTGMDAAQGEYIGFVESDDWIEPQMYEKLYEKAVKYDVDVVKSLFTEVCDGKPKKLMNKFGASRLVHQRIDDVSRMPLFAGKHPSHWSAIYRKLFIVENDIRFHTSPGAASQDIGFNWQVFEKMKSLYVLPMSFYNYRLDNPNSSGAQLNKSAAGVLREWTWIQSLEKNSDINIAYKEIKAHSMFCSLWWNYSAKCARAQKWKYLIKVSELCRKYLSEISYVHFTRDDRRLFKAVARHPRLYILRTLFYECKRKQGLKKIKVLGISVKETKTLPNQKIKYILGLPFVKQTKEAKESKHYFLGIPYKSTKRDGNKEKHYFFGCKYKTTTLRASEDRNANDVRLLQVIAHANAVSDTHRRTFQKYKNCNQGKDVVLIASGPTLNHFMPIKEAVYVGVNSVAGYNSVQYDYLFFQDFMHPQAREILRQISDYQGAKKFYGISQEIISRNWVVPESAAIRDHAERYYVISQWKFPPVHFPYDIANEPLGDCGSVSFAAMQFILWTNPRRIYLAGQDVSSSYWDKTASHISSRGINNIMRGWREMKKFINTWYPDVEIISINPVGLKNMFKDVYTQSYLKDHPEMIVSNDQIIDNE